MKHFLYDDTSDRELISQLKSERDTLKEHLHFLETELRTTLGKLADAKPTPSQQPGRAMTREEIARQLRIPEHLVNQIDFERLGMQVQSEAAGKAGTRR